VLDGIDVSHFEVAQCFMRRSRGEDFGVEAAVLNANRLNGFTVERFRVTSRILESLR
jgi:hypothetical protein